MTRQFAVTVCDDYKTTTTLVHTLAITRVTTTSTLTVRVFIVSSSHSNLHFSNYVSKVPVQEVEMLIFLAAHFLYFYDNASSGIQFFFRLFVFWQGR